MRSTTSSDVELGAVDDDGVGGAHGLRGVAPVALGQRGGGRGVALLAHAPARAHLGVGVEPDLELGLGPDDRADVAALGDGVAARPGTRAGPRAAPRARPGGARPPRRARSTSGLRSSGSSDIVARQVRQRRPAPRRPRVSTPAAQRRQRHARGTSRPCRGSGSRARRRPCARPSTCPRRPGPSMAITTGAPPGARPRPRSRGTRRRSRRARRRARRCARRARRRRRAWRCGGRRAASTRPPSRPRGHAADPPAVVGRATCPPIARSSSADRLEAVRLLHAQLRGAAHDGAAARHRGGEREQRQLVDQARHDLGLDLGRDELGRMHLDVGDRLAARGRAAVEEVDAGAHALEHGQQAGARGVGRHAAHEQARLGSSVAATRNGAAEEMSPGTSTAPSSRRSAGHTETRARALGDARARGAQQPLGVVARRHAARSPSSGPWPRRGRPAGRTT